MTERERWELRGPVRSCRIERTWYSRPSTLDACESDERHDTAIVEFRPDGALASHWHQDHDGSQWKMEREYDDKGRLVHVRTENATDEQSVQTYEYDNEARLSQVVERHQDGRKRVAESYEYDANGRKQKIYYIDVALQLPNTQYAWGIDGSDTSVSAPGAATITTLHNERDQPIEVTLRDAVGTLLVRVDLVYGEAGRLLEENLTRTADWLPPEIRANMNPAELEAVRALIGSPADPARTFHRYDNRGRRIETRSRLFGPLGEHRKIMTYNDHDDLVEEINEDEQREFDVGDSGQLSERPSTTTRHRSEARFDYGYDDRGNWVKKVVEGRARADEEFVVSGIERRTLVYYD